ncbi:hypothetical protein F5884DRAFT_757666 [Xylogone sp. PMI_703]|nr:hypothetical protein F5884DRAFT_757666 [Xylogone sp. PMI_703]
MPRRKRARRTGALDDCFACIKHNTKCDRQRPYYSQCIEKEEACTGYKTNLTWGVGVASRGKLRGLTSPVAKSTPVLPHALFPKKPRKTPSNKTERGGTRLDTPFSAEPEEDRFHK